MARLTNTDGTRIGYLAVDLNNGEVSEIFNVLARAAAGFYFKATPADNDVTVEARQHSDNPMISFDWVNLSEPNFLTGKIGIDLSTYEPEAEITFDIRVTASDPLSGDGIRRLVVYLAVSSSSAAAWEV